MKRDPFCRGLAIGAHLASGGVLTTRFIRERLGVSPAQAKRYMLAAEVELRANATVGERGKVELRLGGSK